MGTYVYKKSCHECGHENYFNRGYDTTSEAEDNGVDCVIDLDFLGQQTFICEECGTEHYSGDYDFETA